MTKVGGRAKDGRRAKGGEQKTAGVRAKVGEQKTAGVRVREHVRRGDWWGSYRPLHPILTRHRLHPPASIRRRLSALMRAAARPPFALDLATALRPPALGFGPGRAITMTTERARARPTRCKPTDVETGGAARPRSPSGRGSRSRWGLGLATIHPPALGTVAVAVAKFHTRNWQARVRTTNGLRWRGINARSAWTMAHGGRTAANARTAASARTAGECTNGRRVVQNRRRVV